LAKVKSAKTNMALSWHKSRGNKANPSELSHVSRIVLIKKQFLFQRVYSTFVEVELALTIGKIITRERRK